ncbi:MAG: hypothetical protein ACK556_21665, partial [Pseudanabaena sp.]
QCHLWAYCLLSPNKEGFFAYGVGFSFWFLTRNHVKKWRELPHKSQKNSGNCEAIPTVFQLRQTDVKIFLGFQ